MRDPWVHFIALVGFLALLYGYAARPFDAVGVFFAFVLALRSIDLVQRRRRRGNSIAIAVVTVAALGGAVAAVVIGGLMLARHVA